MRIKIPEFEGREDTPEFLIDMLIAQLNITINELSRGHNLIALSDGTGVFLNMGTKFLNIAESFQTIVKCGKDIVSSYSLLRMMADYLATMYLIFENKDQYECLFRYLLFFRDGFCKRIEVLGYEIKNNGRISQEQYKDFSEQMDSAKQNAEQGIKECDKLLDTHPYKTINNALFNKIKACNQWKYKKFNAAIKSYESYKWEELYSFIDDRESIQSFYSYLSQYVHGLSNSLIATSSPDDFYAVQCIGMTLIDRYRYLLESLYGGDSIKKLMSIEILENLDKYLPYILNSLKKRNLCQD